MKWMRTGFLVITSVCLALIALFFAWIFWNRWDSEKNRGFTFGYWGEFNRVSNALASMPSVALISSGHNHDLTLEEFHFEIRNSEGRELDVWFGEDDPIRSMSGQKLSRALAEKIQKQASNQSLER